MLSIHKMVAGEGFRYLTRHVAVNDGAALAGQSVTDYYAASGNPPGRWLGQGLDALGRIDVRITPGSRVGERDRSAGAPNAALSRGNIEGGEQVRPRRRPQCDISDGNGLAPGQPARQIDHRGGERGHRDPVGDRRVDHGTLVPPHRAADRGPRAAFPEQVRSTQPVLVDR